VECSRLRTKAPGRPTVPVGLKRVGREMRMLVENADDKTPADLSLLRILARAHHIQARLIQNRKLTVHDIAREEQVSAAYLYTLLHLPGWRPTSPCPSSMAENRRN
jgi:site-specific DNA recombinase